jgi:hypothetical protein
MYIGGQSWSSPSFISFWLDKIARRFTIMLLLDMSKKRRVRKVPLSTGTAKLPLCFFFGLNNPNIVWTALFLAHKYKLINSKDPH